MTLTECRQAARDIVADTICAGLNGDLPHRAAMSLLMDMEYAVTPEAKKGPWPGSWIRADITNLDLWRNSAIGMGRPERAEYYRRIIEVRKAASAAIEGA